MPGMNATSRAPAARALPIAGTETGRRLVAGHNGPTKIELSDSAAKRDSEGQNASYL